MSTNEAQKSRFVVVIGIDNSPYAGIVLATAIDSVRDRPNAELHIVHSVEIIPDQMMLPVLAEAREYLGRVGRDAVDACAARVTTHLAKRTPWRDIVQTAVYVEADLIVVGTHGRKGVSRLLMGSQAELVVRNAPCPVLAVRPKAYREPIEQIEPACPACLEAQARTGGEQLWCARHAEHHPRPHLHYEFPESYGRGSMLIQPEV